ncbi:HEAT repeat domain-containing protein [Halorussus marinus]|uniref:HEAT repeat domain-containing protein n=1 Tax=Halorussus marinus TaxID=2505976 RepID=UPI00106DE006|nr:HEAT repeat domain-containing protein [Halorussus marinus]
MSDDEADAPAEDAKDDPAEADAQTPVSADTVEDQLDAAAQNLDAAETETDLDAVEAELDKIEGLLESADLPEPDDEDEESRREEYESQLSDLRGDLEAARGPYAEDVIEEIEGVESTVADTRWTDDGRDQLRETVETFVAEVEEILDTDLAASLTTDIEDLSSALSDAAVAVGDAALDPDDDADTIAQLVEAAETLQTGVEDAEEWDDLETRDQLRAQGFYEVLDHRKDYPPEWHALKVWEKRDRADMVLLALESLESNFMERHCLESLERMGNPDSLDAMVERAGRRDKPAIRILGKIGEEEGLDAVLDYVDSDPNLAKPALKAAGEIGSDEATQPVADRLVADDPSVRSQAARALGLIGDTRAIEPLADTLENDEADEVRASAAWALNQIGTERALDAVRPYTDDRAFLVQSEAEKAL